MTAEIAILNRSAVALGADSAATVSRKTEELKDETKVFKSANKIFALSRTAPIGVMIFGDAAFMGVPWETLIKCFRSHLGGKTFSTLNEYVIEFFRYLEEHPHLFPDDVQNKAIFTQMVKYAFALKETIGPVKGKRKANQRLRELIQSSHHQIMSAPLIGDRRLSEKDFKGLVVTHDQALTFIIDRVFDGYTISQSNRRKLKQVLTSAFARLWYEEADCGIVFAGFGEDEYFPRLESYYCAGIFENVVSAVLSQERAVTTDSYSDVVPFAKTEMVQTFMYGYDPAVYAMMPSLLESAFKEFIKVARQHAGPSAANKIKGISKTIEDNFRKEFAQWAFDNHYAPILRIVDVLSKDELAELVETFITMESLKKRINEPVESVGGPVDVAVISKGEGLIWIKRKHYFDPEKNYQYFQRVRSETTS